MALIDDVKNYLDITWEIDQAETDKLDGIINRGIWTLDKKAGRMLDYDTEGRPKELLLEYCRFARDGTLNEFAGAYAPMLKDLIEDNGGSYGL
ncbi:hypothetical protein Q5O14_16300 [Eubacteriaceae bacterium ES2]|nr:hypothetical protein Q5O14_16300 [Eubacteriaceae bacterium ES2]